MAYKIKENYLTPNRWSRPQRPAKVEWICVHWEAVVNARAESVRSFFESRKSGKKGYGSAHEIIDTDGSVLKVIPSNEMAYSVGAKTYTKEKYKMMGNTYPNSVVYSIEVPTVDMKGHYSSVVYTTMVERVADLLIEHNLGMDKVTTHGIIAGKDCPKLFHPKWNSTDHGQLNKFLGDVAKVYGMKVNGGSMALIDIKFKMSNKIVRDCDEDTVDKLSPYLDPYEKVLYEYCGRVLKYGMWKPQHKEDVLKLQKAYNKLGFNVTEDGKFGGQCKRTTETFQSRNNVSISGEVDEALAKLINTALNKLQKGE